MWAVAVLASQTRAPRRAPERNSGQIRKPDMGRRTQVHQVTHGALWHSPMLWPIDNSWPLIISICRVRSEWHREGGVGQPDRVPALLPELRRRSGQHLAVSISVLQKWWRSANCLLDTCHVMCYCHLLGLFYSFNWNVKLSFCLLCWHLATTNTLFWFFISLTYE